MPILLDTPWSPGSRHPGNTYPRAKIVGMGHDIEKKAIGLRIEFGDEVGGVWTKGLASQDYNVDITGSDYDTLMATTPGEGETVYGAAKRELYEYLIANETLLAGTIE